MTEPSAQETADHPVISRFAGYVGPRPANTLVDYSGAIFDGAWLMQTVSPEPEPMFISPRPGVNEEYFEWIDLMESVEAAGPTYTMVELGAGYGRWGVRAGLLARSRGIEQLHLLFVEGEPKHVGFVRGALELNGLAGCSRVIEGAISYDGRPVPFVIGHDTQKVGYGQCAGWEGVGEETGETYCGKPVFRTPTGWHQIMVDPITLEEVLQDLTFVDLIDMDLQRAELELVRHSMATLDQKVRRVHIGTHGPEIEEALRSSFEEHGWANVWDFGCLKINSTPYGAVDFVDGVQGWINPRLA